MKLGFPFSGSADQGGTLKSVVCTYNLSCSYLKQTTEVVASKLATMESETALQKGNVGAKVF